jgi:hypothetical protein
LFDCFASFLFRGKPKAEIMSALYFDSQTIVTSSSVTRVKRFHDIDAGQRHAITNVRASNGFRPESNIFCVYSNVTGIAHDETKEMGFAN